MRRARFVGRVSGTRRGDSITDVIDARRRGRGAVSSSAARHPPGVATPQRRG